MGEYGWLWVGFIVWLLFVYVVAVEGPKKFKEDCTARSGHVIENGKSIMSTGEGTTYLCVDKGGRLL